MSLLDMTFPQLFGMMVAVGSVIFLYFFVIPHRQLAQAKAKREQGQREQVSSDSGSQSSDNIMSMLDWTVLPPRYYELVSMRLTLRADEPTSQPTIEPTLIERIREEVAADLAKQVGLRCEKSLDSFAAEQWQTKDGKRVTREQIFGLMRMQDKEARVLMNAADERLRVARAEALKLAEEAALAAARADTTKIVPPYESPQEYEQEEQEKRSQPLTLATVSR